MNVNAHRALVVIAVQVIPLLVGLVLMRRGIARKEWGKPLSRFIIYFFNTGVATMSPLYLPREADMGRLLAISVLFCGAVTVAGAAMSRLHRGHAGRERGSYIIGSALSNYGFTMAGFVCNIFYGKPALAMQSIFLLPVVFYIFMVWFSIGRYYGDEVGDVGPLGSFLMIFKDVTSLPLAGIITGVVVNRVVGVSPQDMECLKPVLDVLVYAGTIASMFCIGITLDLSSVFSYNWENVTVAVTKFVFGPALGFVLATLFGLSGIDRYVVVILTSVPVGLFTSFAANIFGLNRDLANSLFIVNTAVYLFVVCPVLVAVLRYLG